MRVFPRDFEHLEDSRLSPVAWLRSDRLSIGGPPALMGWLLDRMTQERHICYSEGLYTSSQLEASAVHGEELTIPAIECSKEPLCGSLGRHCGSVDRSSLVSTSLRMCQRFISAESSILCSKTAWDRMYENQYAMASSMSMLNHAERYPPLGVARC